MLKKGDTVIVRSYGAGGTMGRLAQDWDGSSPTLFFTEMFFLREYKTDMPEDGSLAAITWQKPKSADVLGHGDFGSLSEPGQIWVIEEDQFQAIKKYWNRKNA